MCIFTSLHTWNNATLSHLVLTIALKYSLSSSFCLRFILSLTMCVPVYVSICEYAMKRCQISWCWNYRKLWVASDECWKLNSGALKCRTPSLLWNPLLPHSKSVRQSKAQNGLFHFSTSPQVKLLDGKFRPVIGRFQILSEIFKQTNFFLPIYQVALYMTSNNQVLEISDSLLEYHRIQSNNQLSCSYFCQTRFILGR